MLQDFGFQTSNFVKFSMDPKLQFIKDTGIPFVDPYIYSSMVDSLQYATNTHLDISYAISIISRHMEQPT